MGEFAVLALATVYPRRKPWLAPKRRTVYNVVQLGSDIVLSAHRACSSRREVLRVGSFGLLGLSCAERLRLRAAAGEQAVVRAKSCILLWLDGGPSHLETWDLKPAATAEVRGPFQPIATNVAGIQISELLPRTATVMNHVAIVRSLTSPLGEHGLANRYLLSGYRPSPVLQYPSYGSVVSKLRTRESLLPPYVAIPTSRLAGAGYLESKYEPFHTEGDPADADF